MQERVSVWADAQVCPEADGMHPWFRQQFIKLHADRLTDGRYVVCLGADALLIRPVRLQDLFDGGGRPILRFFRYGRPNAHLRFERGRVLNVARLLGAEPARSFLPGDFICDLFLFDTEVLRGLRQHLGGTTAMAQLLERLGDRQSWDDRFGEWTTYAVFTLDCLRAEVGLQQATPAFFTQIHSRSDVADPRRYDGQVVHFAWKPDPVTLAAELARMPAGALRDQPVVMPVVSR